MTGPLPIRTAVVADVPELAELHAGIFDANTSVLSLFGRGYLKSVYSYFADSPETFTLVAESESGDRITGWVALCRRPYVRALLRATWSRLLGAFVRRPWVLFDRRFVRRLRDQRNNLRDSSGPAPELAVIAVHPEWRGRGVGAALLQKAEAQARRQGWTEVVTGTYRSNTAAASLFRRAGWLESESRSTPLALFFVLPLD